MDMTAVQKALKAQGFDPGDIDGVPGRRTIAAIKAFQQAKGLSVDGVVGPQTAKALLGETPKPADTVGMPWFEEARRLMGLHEVSGPGSNPAILQWASSLGIPYNDDDIPWCGLFVAHCVGATLPGEPLPNNPLGARNWNKFGTACKPVLGAVLVFWRGSKNGSLGHVGFYNGEDDAAYQVLGGNQSDSVSIARVAKDRLLGARQPSSVPPLTSGRVIRTTSGELSHNEA